MSSILSDRLMSKVRTKIEQYLVQTCTIERPAYSVNEYGARVRTIGTPITSICLLTRNTRTSPQQMAEKDQARVYYNLQLPYDTDIRDGDEVVIDEERYYTQQVLRSQGVDVMRQAILVKHGS